MTTLFALVRAVHFASLMTIFGASLFAWIAREPSLRRPLALAAAAALVTAILSLGLITAEMTGVPQSAYDPASLGIVAGQSFYGQVFLLRFAFLIGLTLLCVANGSAGLKAIAAGVPLALLGLTSHTAAAGAPQQEYLRAANDAAHLLTAGAWLGGLVALAPDAFARPPDPERLAARLRLFSRYGTLSVAVLILSGTVNALAILGVRGMPWSGTYVGWLTAKLVLAAVMIALALTNRFGLLPSLVRREREAAETIPLTVGAELACALLIVLIVGFLGLLPPMQM